MPKVYLHGGKLDGEWREVSTASYVLKFAVPLQPHDLDLNVVLNAGDLTPDNDWAVEYLRTTVHLSDGVLYYYLPTGTLPTPIPGWLMADLKANGCTLEK